MALGESSGLKAAALSATLSEPMKDVQRSISGAQAALSSRAEAHSTVLALMSELETRRGRLAGARGGGDVSRAMGEERELQILQEKVDQAKREYTMVCERLAGELKRSDAARAQQLSAIARALGAAEKEMAADQAKAYTLMGVGA